MAVVTLYKTVITPDRNCEVDDIKSMYLNTLESDDIMLFGNIQYQKVDELTLSLKLPIAQDVDVGGYNYCEIDQDQKRYYYFIKEFNWISSSTKELILVMDTINTFEGEYVISEKTTVIRQHTQRYSTNQKYSSEGFNLYPEIDKEPEGVNAPLFKVSDEKVETSGHANQNWYLVYKSQTAETNAPLDVYLYPKRNDVPFAEGYNVTVTWTYQDIPSSSYLIFPDSNICYRRGSNNKIQSRTYTVEGGLFKPALTFSELNSLSFNTIRYYYTGIENQNYMSILRGVVYEIKAGYQDIAYLDSIDSVDRSLSNVVKVIELPYLPSNITWSGNNIQLSGTGFERTDTRLHLINRNSEFENTIKSIVNIKELYQSIDGYSVDNLKSWHYNKYDAQTYNKYLEPKMYNSAFFNYKLNYDTFNIQIDLEKLKRQSVSRSTYNIKFKPSNALSSELAFKWDMQDTEYLGEQDYPQVLVSSRNNELGLINSQYLDYLRTGYQADNEAKRRNNIRNWIGAGSTALTIVGAILSKGTTLATPLLFNASAQTINTISNAIGSAVEQDATIQAKLEQYNAQGANVSNNNAVDIFNWYNGNKLHIMKYQPSDTTSRLLLDLFHYCGYARNRKEAINYNNRLWFNYIQCEPIFESQSIPTIFLEDIKARYSMGVTRYHHGVLNGEEIYDWEQQYVNWEKSIFS